MLKKCPLSAKDSAQKMLAFFRSFDGSDGIPSFTKFARSLGCSTHDLLSLRSRKEFDDCFRECLEIRRDILIDQALTKRFDPSFVKFLLSEVPFGEENQDRDSPSLSVTLEVIGNRESASQSYPETESLP